MPELSEVTCLGLAYAKVMGLVIFAFGFGIVTSMFLFMLREFVRGLRK